MLYVYAVLSAVGLLIAGNIYPLFQNQNAWWLIPVLFLAGWLALILCHIILFVIAILIINPKSPQKRASGFYRWAIKYTIPMIFKLVGVRIHTSGSEKIPEDKRVLLVCNHIHDFDPVVIISEFPDLELGFIAKKEIYVTLKVVAKAMRKLHCLPIDRENDREAAKTIVSAIKLIRDDIVSVGVFPEGYTSRDGKLHEFRNGSFKIALKANCPIVVCTLDSTNKILKNLFKRKTDVYLDVADVITEEELAQMNTVQIGERVHKTMEESLARTQQKKQKKSG